MQSQAATAPMEGQSTGGGKRRESGSEYSEKNLKQQFIGIAEQGLHLLWNLRYIQPYTHTHTHTHTHTPLTCAHTHIYN